MAEESKTTTHQGDVSLQDVDTLTLMERCNADKPAEADINELRKRLAETPEVGRELGCLAQLVIDRRLDQSFNGMSREFVRARLLDMAAELRYEQSPELEKMLIKHILWCWLDLYVVQVRAVNLDNESHSLNVGLYRDKRLNSAQRRFLKATDSLAKIRKTIRQVELRENRQESAGKTKTKRSLRITEEK